MRILERLARKEARGNLIAYEKALLRDITGILTELDQTAAAWVKDTIPKEYRAGMTKTLAQLARADPTLAATAQMTQIHKQAVEVLANNLYGDLTDAHRQVGR